MSARRASRTAGAASSPNCAATRERRSPRRRSKPSLGARRRRELLLPQEAGDAAGSGAAHAPPVARLGVGHLELARLGIKEEVEDTVGAAILPDLGRRIAADEVGRAEEEG